MSEIKTKQNNASVDEFLGKIADQAKCQDAAVLVRIFSEATGERPKMWGDSIVGFGSYHYKYASGKEGDWMLTGFSPRKNNLTLYIMSGFDEYADASGYNPKPLLAKLGPHTIGKSCLYIKSLEAVDHKVLKQLIQNSYEQMKKLHKSS